MGKKCAVIVSAGQGKRMMSNINKHFIKLKGKPILFYTLNAFSTNPLIDEIILVVAKNEIETVKKEVIEKYNILKVKNVVAGGSTRQESVFLGLTCIKECEIVLIHDGARPFVNDKIISDGIKFAQIYNACACGVTPKDTIKVRDKNGFSTGTLDRNSLFSVQTPQCFKYELILDCHKKLKIERKKVTDDTMVVERYGKNVYLYEGSYANIKITTPEDLAAAENMIEKKIQHIL